MSNKNVFTLDLDNSLETVAGRAILEVALH
jgi:hypothetical protein